MKKTIFTLIIILTVLSSFLTVTARDVDKKQLQIADSKYFLTVADDFRSETLTDVEKENNIIGHYLNTESGLEIFVHAADASGYYSYETFALKRAPEFGAESKKVNLNGIPAAFYAYNEKYVDDVPLNEMGGAVYNEDDVVTENYLVYVLENGNVFLEITFKLNGDLTEIEAALAMLTLEKKQYIQLGTSDFYIYAPSDYEKGDISEKDISENQVGYYRSDMSFMDFDVYQIPMDIDGENLENFAKTAAEEKDSGILQTRINDIPAYYFYSTENYDNTDYKTLTYIFAGEKDYIKIVFWHDNDSFEEVMDVVSTLRTK